MLAPPRIALISRLETPLWSELTALPCTPQVKRFSDLVAEAEALRRFGPRVVVLRKSQLTAEDIGSWKVLRSLLPDAATLVVVDGEHLAVARALVAESPIGVLADPIPDGALAQAIGSALTPARSASLDLLLELARAIGDEVNNPLLFVSGHVRLLREALDREQHPDLHARVLGVAENVQRIESTMAKLRTLVRAAATPRSQVRTPLAKLVREALAKDAPPSRDSVDLVIPEEFAEVPVAGDPALLRSAVKHFVMACRELARDPAPLVLVLGPSERGLRLRVDLQPHEPVAWDLPRDTEPFSLMRAVRGSAAQLSLLVVQSIAVAHGGAATLLRRPDERVVLEVTLPVSA